MTSPSSPSSPAPVQGPDGLLAGRYRLERLLGSGGYAEVWCARDAVLGRTVAIKILHRHLSADPEVRTRFRREAVAAARISHPNIVAVFDTVIDGVDALVLEMVDGPTLRQLLATRGRLEPSEVVHLGAELAAGLGAAHDAGVVHRDLKPGNVLLAGDGRILISDLGLARIADDADLTQPDRMLGTARYLAPELLGGSAAGPPADVYALGVLLFESLTGRLPFDGDGEIAHALARVRQRPLRARQVRPEVPRSLDLALDRLLHPDPSRRPADGAAARAELLATSVTPGWSTPRGAHDDRAVDPATPTVTFSPSFRESERRFLVPAMVVVLATLALGAAGMILDRTGVARDLFRATREAVTGTSSDPLPVTAVSAFDPAGDGDEHGERAWAVADDDPSTTWVTESYRSPTLDPKPGVGVVLRLDGLHDVRHVRILSTTTGWSAEVHVAEAPATTLAGWGPAIGSVTAAAPTTTIDLDGARGSAVLVWITNLGGQGPPFRFETASIELLG